MSDPGREEYVDIGKATGYTVEFFIVTEYRDGCESEAYGKIKTFKIREQAEAFIRKWEKKMRVRK